MGLRFALCSFLLVLCVQPYALLDLLPFVACLPDHIRANCRVPWRAILCSAPVWAMCISLLTFDYGMYTLMTNVPSYLKDVQKLDITSVSSLSFVGVYCQLLIYSLGFFVLAVFLLQMEPLLRQREFEPLSSACFCFAMSWYLCWIALESHSLHSVCQVFAVFLGPNLMLCVLVLPPPPLFLCFLCCMQSGIFSALPFFLMWLMTIVAGFWTGLAVVQKHFSFTVQRKILTFIGKS